METYPSWSPDGTSLYFSRSEADEMTSFDSIRYDIYRIAFDPVTDRVPLSPGYPLTGNTFYAPSTIMALFPSGTKKLTYV
jgi:hypothetical protein